MMTIFPRALDRLTLIRFRDEAPGKRPASKTPATVKYQETTQTREKKVESFSAKAKVSKTPKTMVQASRTRPASTATTNSSDDGLFAELQGAEVELHCIGDSLAARTAHMAIYEARKLGQRL